MTSDIFRRHTRACVDRAVHQMFVALHGRHAFFERLLQAARERSDLMSHAPTTAGEVVQVDVLRNLARFEAALIRRPEAWDGMTGHPLCVVDSLASHLFGCYRTPRFLASAWFGDLRFDRVERRRWFIAHARGQQFRSLPLPLTMTRRMEHLFLRTPDHLAIDPALRRAEILGLGGTSELADVILTTRLAEEFHEPERWRAALTWLVGCQSSVDLNQIRPLIDFLRANPTIDPRGRSFVSALRLMREWHVVLGHSRARFVAWLPCRAKEMVVPVAPTTAEPRRAEWRIVELLDSHELVQEGRAMRHCVASYVRSCAIGWSSIWSLRQQWCDEPSARSVLTIEVHPATRTIVQIRGPANSMPRGWPLELVRRWAAREGLQLAAA